MIEIPVGKNKVESIDRDKVDDAVIEWAKKRGIDIETCFWYELSPSHLVDRNIPVNFYQVSWGETKKPINFGVQLFRDAINENGDVYHVGHVRASKPELPEAVIYAKVG